MSTNVASIPAVMAGFPVIKNAEAAFDKQDSAQLKEWLECQDFILVMKAIAVGHTDVRNESLRYLQGIANIFSGEPIENEIVRVGLSLYIAEPKHPALAGEEVASIMSEMTIPVMEQLTQASLENKRAVLRYAKIIPSPIAAAYIGVSEHALNEWNNCHRLFGERYAGGHAYSLAEIQLIASNRFWMYSEMGADDTRSTESYDAKALDEVVLVDPEVAFAFTDASYGTLAAKLPFNQLIKRPFRLSDLEKIRVAKLNGQQH